MIGQGMFGGNGPPQAGGSLGGSGGGSGAGLATAADVGSFQDAWDASPDNGAQVLFGDTLFEWAGGSTGGYFPRVLQTHTFAEHVRLTGAEEDQDAVESAGFLLGDLSSTDVDDYVNYEVSVGGKPFLEIDTLTGGDSADNQFVQRTFSTEARASLAVAAVFVRVSDNPVASQRGLYAGAALITPGDNSLPIVFRTAASGDPTGAGLFGSLQYTNSTVGKGVIGSKTLLSDGNVHHVVMARVGGSSLTPNELIGMVWVDGVLVEVVSMASLDLVEPGGSVFRLGDLTVSGRAKMQIRHLAVASLNG